MEMFKAAREAAMVDEEIDAVRRSIHEVEKGIADCEGILGKSQIHSAPGRNGSVRYVSYPGRYGDKNAHGHLYSEAQCVGIAM